MNEAPTIVPDSELLTRHGCGPIQFSGTDDALYERHLLFDASSEARNSIAAATSSALPWDLRNQIKPMKALGIPEDRICKTITNPRTENRWPDEAGAGLRARA